MFVDARTIPDNEVLETDICIIGAGAAGITLAREFAGLPVRVSVCEGGGLEYDAETQALTAGENIGLPYFPLDAARLRFFGGTTNHWGGTCRPFDEMDFVERPWVPYSGWPISRSELQPYYERAGEVCGVRSPEWSTDYWLQNDKYPALPLASDKLLTRIAQVVQTKYRRFALNYRTELEQASNVTTYLYANATELETDEVGGTVLQAHVACLSGNRFVIKAKHFILASGAIENARLLLLSNRHQPAGLGNQHDQVGRYFMEHPRLVTGILAPTDTRLPMGLYKLHHVLGATVKGYMALSEAVQRSEELVDVQIDLDPVYEQAYVEALASDDVKSLKALSKAFREWTTPEDFRQHVSNVVADLTGWRGRTLAAAPLPLPKPEVINQVWQADPEERASVIADLLGDSSLAVYAELYGSVPVEYIQVSTRVEQIPNPDSRVTLMEERDALGQPRAQLDWRLTPLERYSIIRSLEILGAELGRAGLGRLQITLSADDSGWPDDLRGGWHHIGTTRMSADPRQGVVDKNCQVHGVSNLFVAGSSVFATSGSGTPTMTLVALALRLADYLKERMR